MHRSPVPELALGSVPRGTHVLVMTHDHAEDFALCDAALRCTHLASVGLIGSAAKWARFRSGPPGRGARRGHRRPDPQPDRVCPDCRARSRQAVAVSVAAELLQLFAADRVRTGADPMIAAEVLYRARAYDTPDDPFSTTPPRPASATTTTSASSSPTTA